LRHPAVLRAGIDIIVTHIALRMQYDDNSGQRSRGNIGMKPKITLLMITSVDGRLHPSRFTSSPDGTRRDWSAQYEKVHETLQADAWLVGRVTMAEISKAGPHAPSELVQVQRPLHNARSGGGTFAVALDPSGKVHFKPGGLGGDHVIALLGRDVPDGHLAELAADGVSYIVSEHADVDVATMLDVLAREFGIRHLVLEGGAATNGAFLAAGLVDEMRILVAPGIDGGENVQGIATYGDGLAGRLSLQLLSAETLDHGVVELHYAVLPPES
jgi:riboflavin biosynthesis pyrimidine reductase